MPRRLHTLLGLLAALLLGGVGIAYAAGPSSPAYRAPALPPGVTIVIGAGGLTWSDVTAQGTPNLWSLLRDGAGGAMAIPSTHANTCPIDGWLGLSAGGRAAATRTGSASDPAARPCPPLPEVPAAPADGGLVQVPGWAGYRASVAGTDFGSVLGTVGEQAAAGGQCIAAVGPGAGLAAARADGTLQRWSAWNPDTLVAALNACPLGIVDVGAVRDDVASGEAHPEQSRAAQVTQIDTRIGQALAAAPAGADIIVASLADAGVQERLRLAVARGPHFGPGELASTSTRQPGLVQAQDVTVTLLAGQGLRVPEALGGAPLKFVAANGNTDATVQDRLRHLVDIGQASYEVHGLVRPFFTVFAYGQVLVYLVALVRWRRQVGSERSGRRILGWTRVFAVAAASVPVSTFLANLFPWWRFSIPMAAVVAAVGLFVLLIAGAALLGPWGRTAWGPMVVVSLVTMVVLALDVLTGSGLQLSSLMGLQPVIGGRFYGVGNVTFAIFVTAALLLATALSSLILPARGPRAAAIAVGIIGLVTIVIDGAPFWGADGGGPPAAIPGFAVLILSILGIALTWRRVLALGAGCVGLFLAVGFLDWLRPASSRTHLGRFIQSLIDGGALEIVTRKAAQNWNLLLAGAPLSLLVPVALVAAGYLLARPGSRAGRALERSYQTLPTLRAGLIGLLVTLVLGFFLNDTGAAIPAVAATVVVPLVIVVAVTALADQARAQARVRRGHRRRRGRPGSPSPTSPPTTPVAATAPPPADTPT